MQTVHKAGEVLNLFSVERPEWGVSEVAEALGSPRSSASGLMSALAAQGLLQRTGKRRYRLGWRVMALSQVLMETTEFRTESREGMEYLLSQFGETVHLAALERGQVIYVDKMQGTRAVQVSVSGRGMKFAAHASSVGKAILAHRPWGEVAEILDVEGMETFTLNTITNLEDFKRELALVRNRGCAYDIEEGMAELSCVAAPIRDHTQEVVASMSLSVPAYRFERGKDRYRAALMETTRKVSQNLGYTGIKRSSRSRANGVKEAAVGS